MKFKKGVLLEARTGVVWMVAGTWNGNVVLSLVDESKEECSLYLPEEIREMIESGQLVQK